LLGITENQITQLEKKEQSALTISVYSPANGYVFFQLQSQQENTGFKTHIGYEQHEYAAKLPLMKVLMLHPLANP
jgi:hypothetical protein